MNWRQILAHDLRMKLRHPAVLFALTLYAAIVAYGAVSGRGHLRSRASAAASNRSEAMGARARLLERMRAREQPGGPRVAPWIGSAMDVTFSSGLRPGPLGDFAVGQSDLLPSTCTLSLWQPDIRLCTKYEFDDPVALATGAFDLSLAVVFVLPLILIALCFDVLSSERDGRRLSLLLAQGADLRRLVWTRLAGRVLVTLLITSVAAMATWITGTAPVESGPWFAAWLAGTGAYVLFWAAMIAVVAADNRSGEVNVFRLAGLWVLTVILIPGAIAALAEAAYPGPSRLAWLAQARTEESRALRAAEESAAGVLSDHPELSAGSATEVPAYIRTAHWVTRRVDQATQAGLAGFEETAEARQGAVSVLGYLSPAVVFYGLAVDLAGTSGRRHRRFLVQARRFKAAFGEKFGPSLVKGRLLTPIEIETLADFQMADQRLGNVLLRHVGALALLLIVTTLLFGVADRGLHRIIGP